MKKLPCLLAVWIMLFSLESSLGTARTITSERLAADQAEIFAGPLDEIVGNVEAEVGYLSSFKTRVTGYGDFYSAAQHINETFHNYGLITEVQEYDVVVPVDHGATIEVLSPVSEQTVIEASVLWPNFVQTCKTPSEGVSGKIIYVNDGDLADFNGKDINGSIVLMNFNSKDNWLTAAKFGAVGVVFIEPSDTNRYESLSKFLLTPIDFPRLYVGLEDGYRLVNLAKADAMVKLTSNMSYETVKGWNIVAKIEGTDYPDEILLLSAHYDSWSVVPAISSGNGETFGIATLLEMARYFSENPPKRTVWLVALSGHWQALAGSREFTEEYVFSRANTTDARIWMQINLDLSDEAEKVDLLWVGNMYKYGLAQATSIKQRYDWILKMIYQSYLPADLLDSVVKYGMDQPEVHWGTQFDGLYILDSEPLCVAGLAAFTIRTSYSYRVWWGTPMPLNSIDSDNLKSQLELVFPIVTGFANEEEEWAPPNASRMEIIGAQWGWYGGAKGFATLIGKVVSFDITSGWYSTVPNALVRVVMGTAPSARINPFVNILAYADESGNYSIHGLPPSTALPQSGGSAGTSTGGAWEICTDAWVVNEESGNVEYAPDVGQYGWLSFPYYVKAYVHPVETTTVVFRSVGVTVYDVIDPSKVNRFRIVDMRNEGFFFIEPRIMLVPYDAYTRSLLIFFGTYIVPNEPVAMFFVKPNEQFTLLLKGGITSSYHVGFLVNATEDYPEGHGFNAGEDDLQISFTAYQFAKDMISVSSSRYDTLKTRYVRSLSADTLVEECWKHVRASESLLENKTYDGAYEEAVLAWTLALRSYNGETMPLIQDLSVTTVIFFVFLILFVFFSERLAFGFEGRNRLLVYVVVTSLLLGFFYLIHPALSLMTNAIIGLLGVLLAIFFSMTFYILLGQTSSYMRETSIKAMGMHESESAKGGTLMISFSVSLQSMKRRRFRTALMFVTIIALSFALTSLSSVSYWTIVRGTDRPWAASYEGMLLKRGDGIPPHDVLDVGLEPYIRNILADRIGENFETMSRVYLYPESVFPTGASTTIEGRNGSSLIRGILGLSSVETENLIGYIRGRPFIESDYFACILPESVSRILGVEYGDYIQWHGIKLLVAGSIDVEFLSTYRDLDDYLLTPIDPESNPMINGIATMESTMRPSSQAAVVTLIIPTRLALDLGGYVASISIRFGESVSHDAIIDLADFLSLSLDISVYTGWKGVATQFSRTRTFIALGIGESIFLLLILGGANILSAMLGSIKERARDIRTFASLGLTPSSVAFLFLSEALIYSVVGVMIGYLMGLLGNSMFSIFNLLPENFVLNYSSVFVTVAIGVIIASCFASSIYPISVAAKLVTPSLQRRWEIKTKPAGDVWTVPLPFVLPTDQEAIACLRFIREYFEKTATESFRTHEVSPVSLEDRKLEVNLSLPPYEMNLSQNVQLAIHEEEGRFHFVAILKLVTGGRSTWIRSNRDFIDFLRKQLLLWRALKPEEREKYVTQAS